MGARLKKLFSRKFWKSMLGMVLYFAVSILVLHDLFVIVAHTIDPKFMEWATPYLLDKLLAALLTTFSI
jgi:hypothetical protein